MAGDNRQLRTFERFKRALMIIAHPARRSSLSISHCVRLSVLAALLLALAGCETMPSDGSPGKKHFFSIFSYNIRSNGKQCMAEWTKAPPLAPGLWQRVEARYQLPNSTTNPRIITERNWYTAHQSYLDRMSARSSRYLYYVAGQLEARNLPGELALLPIVESAYNPFAVSTSNASGLWQFIPSTAKHLNMEMNWWYDARRDVPAATDSALNYLVFLRDHYDGDWLKALAAYNAGWGTIDKAVAKNKARGLPTDYWNLDVPAETRAYVPKLLALAQISKDPSAYGVSWAYIPDLPYFAEVRFRGQMDVAFAADLAKVDSDELYQLNPGISRWATPPGGPYRLLVPIDQADELQEGIASLNASQLMPTPSYAYENTANPRVQEMEAKMSSRASQAKSKPTNVATPSSSAARQTGSRTYVVKKGDTVWSVAKKAGTTPDALRKSNKLANNAALKPGQKLTVPGSTEPTNVSSGSSTRIAANDKATTHLKTANPQSASRVSQTFKPASKVDDNNAAKGKASYTVKSGDTLMAISRKYSLNVNDIARWNGLNKNQAALKPGQNLTLYLDSAKKH